MLVGVLVAVAVGVLVSVGVAVGDPVGVAVCVAVGVPVGVDVTVGVGVHVPGKNSENAAVTFLSESIVRLTVGVEPVTSPYHATKAQYGVGWQP